ISGWMRVRDPIGAQGVPATRQLGINAGAAPPGRIPFLENEEPGPFAKHETVPGAVEGTAGPLGAIVVGGEGVEKAKCREPNGTHHGVESARKDEVRDAAADELQGRSNGLSPGGTGRVNGARVAPNPETPEEKGKPRVGLAPAKLERIEPAFLLG